MVGSPAGHVGGDREGCPWALLTVPDFSIRSTGTPAAVTSASCSAVSRWRRPQLRSNGWCTSDPRASCARGRTDPSAGRGLARSSCSGSRWVGSSRKMWTSRETATARATSRNDPAGRRVNPNRTRRGGDQAAPHRRRAAGGQPATARAGWARRCGRGPAARAGPARRRGHPGVLPAPSTNRPAAQCRTIWGRWRW